MAIFPGGISRPVVYPPNDGSALMHTDSSHTQATTDIIEAIDGEASGEPTLTAFLVEDDTGVVATATLLDVEDGEKINLHCGLRASMGPFIMASLTATAVAVPVMLTHSGSA
jgi:hypothetical protein